MRRFAIDMDHLVYLSSFAQKRFKLLVVYSEASSASSDEANFIKGASNRNPITVKTAALTSQQDLDTIIGSERPNAIHICVETCSVQLPQCASLMFVFHNSVTDCCVLAQRYPVVIAVRDRVDVKAAVEFWRLFGSAKVPFDLATRNLTGYLIQSKLVLPPPNTRCQLCGNPRAKLECRGCFMALYCDNLCAVMDWPRHNCSRYRGETVIVFRVWKIQKTAAYDTTKASKTSKTWYAVSLKVNMVALLCTSPLSIVVF